MIDEVCKGGHERYMEGHEGWGWVGYALSELGRS